MEIQKQSFIAFAYTVKTLGTDNAGDYSPFFDKLSKFNIEVEYKISETDKLGKLHYHGIFYLPKGFFRKRLATKGFHMKLVEIYNKQGWYKYITKDCAYDDMPKEPQSPTLILKKSLFK